MGLVASTGADNDDLVDKLIDTAIITSEPVEKVFRLVDRGRFFPPHKRNAAYKDIAWKSDEGSPGHVHISAPCIYSNVLENLELKEGQTFLNIGSGTGYFNTLVGFLIGSKGRNHGIEIHHNIVDYARNLVTETLKGPEVQCFDWAVPEFTVGNGLLLSPAHYCRYDRIYVGAAVPSSHKRILWELLKVDGILVMPYDDQLLQVRRKQLDVFDIKIISSVSFSGCILPSNEEVSKGQYSEAPLINVQTLQFICASYIRKIIRESLAKSHPVEIRNHVSVVPVHTSEQDPVIITYRDGASDGADVARLPLLRRLAENVDGAPSDTDDDDADDDVDEGEGNLRRVVENFRRRRLEAMRERARAFLSERAARRIARSWIHLRRRDRRGVSDDEEVDVVGNGNSTDEHDVNAMLETESNVVSEENGENRESNDDVEPIGNDSEAVGKEKNKQSVDQGHEQSGHNDESSGISPFKKRVRYSEVENMVRNRPTDSAESADNVQCTRFTDDKIDEMFEESDPVSSIEDAVNDSGRDVGRVECNTSGCTAQKVMEDDRSEKKMPEDDKVVVSEDQDHAQEEKETSVVEIREEPGNAREESSFVNEQCVNGGCGIVQDESEVKEGSNTDEKSVLIKNHEMEVYTDSLPQSSDKSSADTVRDGESDTQNLQNCEKRTIPSDTQKGQSDIDHLEGGTSSSSETESNEVATGTTGVEANWRERSNFLMPHAVIQDFLSEQDTAGEEVERMRLRARALQQRDLDRFAKAFEGRIRALPIGIALIEYVAHLH